MKIFQLSQLKIESRKSQIDDTALIEEKTWSCSTKLFFLAKNKRKFNPLEMKISQSVKKFLLNKLKKINMFHHLYKSINIYAHISSMYCILILFLFS